MRKQSTSKNRSSAHFLRNRKVHITCASLARIASNIRRSRVRKTEWYLHGWTSRRGSFIHTSSHFASERNIYFLHVHFLEWWRVNQSHCMLVMFVSHSSMSTQDESLNISYTPLRSDSICTHALQRETCDTWWTSIIEALHYTCWRRLITVVSS